MLNMEIRRDIINQLKVSVYQKVAVPDVNNLKPYEQGSVHRFLALQGVGSIDRCCAIYVPKGGPGVGQWLVKSGSQANYERGTPGPPGHPRAAHPQTWDIATTSAISTTAISNTTSIAILIATAVATAVASTTT